MGGIVTDRFSGTGKTDIVAGGQYRRLIEVEPRFQRSTNGWRGWDAGARQSQAFTGDRRSAHMAGY